MASRLFSPIELRGLSVANRITVAPMCQYSATDGVVGDWHLAHQPDGFTADQLALGWLLGQYRFTRYAGSQGQGPRLVCPEGADAERALAIAGGEFLTRDLIHTPGGVALRASDSVAA